MRIPLFNRLKKRAHREVAMLQDEVVEIVYSISPNSVLHGGTAIWRCYSGNRFSEDLDFYHAARENFREKLSSGLAARGLSLLKFKETANTSFSSVSNGTAEVKLEFALRKPPSFVAGSYEKADGASLGVFVLSPDSLVLEKIAAYSSRRLIRDFYDIYHLSSQQLGESTLAKIRSFAKTAEPPLDEKSLRAVVYSGAIPSFAQMGEALGRRR